MQIVAKLWFIDLQGKKSYKNLGQSNLRTPLPRCINPFDIKIITVIKQN